MSKTIIVSNRLPNLLIKSDDGIFVEKSVGGLATALDSILRNNDSIWIGHCGVSEKEWKTHFAEFDKWFNEDRYLAFSVPDRTYKRFYDGHVTGYLWYVFHGNLIDGIYRKSHWEAYKEVNGYFRDRILEQYKHGDIVWVNDFQLFPDMKIGFFLHIPFPSADVFETVPNAKEMMEGVIAADIIGFHTKNYADNFASTAKRLKLYQATIDKLVILPVGTNCALFEGDYEPLDIFPNQKIILSAERMDFIKGIPEKLRSFEMLLDKHPNLHKKIVLIQIAAASRGDNETVERLVGRINGGFGTFDWSPVIYSNTGLDKENLAKLYRRADILWVNSTIDGLNLVCKEYIASRTDNSGNVILSKFAGSASELPEAILVNPYDVEGTSETLYEVITDKRKTDMQTLRDHVKRNTAEKWAEHFLGMFDDTCS
jgi:trehalose 6-phosphate synthase/phosphatase